MINRYYDGISIQNRRAENMDSLLLRGRLVSGRSLYLAVVSDGVGGTKDGGFAAGAAARLLNDWFDSVEDITRLGLQLRDQAVQINHAIADEAEVRGLNTAATLSALLLIDERYYVVHLGDSRIYCYETGRLRQITRDDVSESGRLTAYLGCRQNVIPYYDEGDAQGKRFLLCSDGLYKRLDEELLQDAFRRLNSRNLKKEAQRLADRAVEKGEKDNISVAFII